MAGWPSRTRQHTPSPANSEHVLGLCECGNQPRAKGSRQASPARKSRAMHHARVRMRVQTKLPHDSDPCRARGPPIFDPPGNTPSAPQPDACAGLAGTSEANRPGTKVVDMQVWPPHRARGLAHRHAKSHPMTVAPIMPVVHPSWTAEAGSPGLRRPGRSNGAESP